MFKLKRIIAITIFGSVLTPIFAQINPFSSEPLNGFERNVRSMLDRGRVEKKNTDRVEESTRQEVHVRQSSSPTKNTETNNIRDKTEIIDENNVHLIPSRDSSSAREVMDFKKKWENKRFTFIGKKNRGDGLSMGAYYINGCDAVMSKFKLGETVKLTGTIVDRTNGGSGGEPIQLKNCSVNDNDRVATKADATPNIKPSTAVIQDTKFGYLAGKIRTFEGNGCEYYLASDDKKKDKKTIGADDFSQSGIILNIDGKDILAKGSIDSKGVFLGAFGTTTLRVITGKSKAYGENGSKSQMSFNLNSSGAVTQTSVVGYCYD